MDPDFTRESNRTPGRDISLVFMQFFSFFCMVCGFVFIYFLRRVDWLCIIITFSISMKNSESVQDFFQTILSSLESVAIVLTVKIPKYLCMTHKRDKNATLGQKRVPLFLSPLIFAEALKVLL